MPGFGGRYEVSNLGRVRSKDMVVGAKGGATATRKGRVLRPSFGYFGYPKYTLANGKERQQVEAHVLVLEAFIGPRPGKWPQVHARHKNGKPKDCRAVNLEWGSALDNNLDKNKHGTMLRGEASGASRLTAAQVLAIRSKRNTAQQDAERYGVTKGHIYAIRRRRCWTHV